jgi:acetyl-CoA carboxylase biotin carboxyl carrier protein
MKNLEWLKKLIRLVEESDIDYLEVSRFSTKVRISKSPPGGIVAAGAAAQAAAPAAGGPRVSSDDGDEGDGDAAPTDAGEGLHEILSPMVGTFYRAPAPDAPPYVEVGDRVTRGQTLCILEAMKLMNELEAEVSGVMREITVQNAEPVEYGQALFRIERDGD